MKRPWRKVVLVEQIERPYKLADVYRSAFVNKCKELGVRFPHKEDVDAALETVTMLRRSHARIADVVAIRMHRLHLACGHYVDVQKTEWPKQRVRCHLCQQGHVPLGADIDGSGAVILKRK
jgi:hypothetical protein